MQSIMPQVILWVKKYASHSNHLFFMSCNKQALSTVHCVIDFLPQSLASLSPNPLTELLREIYQQGPMTERSQLLIHLMHFYTE